MTLRNQLTIVPLLSGVDAAPHSGYTEAIEPEQMIKIALYCPQPVVADGLQALVADQYDLTNIGGTVEQMKELLLACSPNILLVDVCNGFSLSVLCQMQEAIPQASVVLWTDGSSPAFLTQALALGVRGLVYKCSKLVTLLNCLACVSKGQAWIDQIFAESLYTSPHVRLTPRERQVVGLVAQGLCNKELAYALNLTEGTVKAYLSKLFDKTGASDRFELALLALKNVLPFGFSGEGTRPEGGDSGPQPLSIPAMFVTKGFAKRSGLPGEFLNEHPLWVSSQL